MTLAIPTGSAFTLAGTQLSINRLGYGAMQLAGPHVWGAPADPAAARAVLREAVSLGVNHIDTADFYGPHVTNQLIKEALHPYNKGLVIVTKVGFSRGADASWNPAHTKAELTHAVHDNLKNLGLDALEVVNLRWGDAHGPNERSLAEPLAVLMDLQKQGLIRNIGLSNITATQFDEAQAMTNIVCVQNQYNLTQRGDDALIDDLAGRGVAYVPYFPLGGFNPLQSAALERCAEQLEASPMQVALAWLLQRSPNILVIAGTKSIKHLRENLKAAHLALPVDVVAELDLMGTSTNA